MNETMNSLSENAQLLKVEELSACDLRVEATDHADAEMWRTDWYNADQVEILWLPSSKRAGISWGSDSVWTDAISVQDALERFFNDDMIN